MSDHPHTPNTDDTADLVRRLRVLGLDSSGWRTLREAAGEIERLSAIVAAVDALITPAADSEFPVDAYRLLVDLYDIIHPEENR